MYGKSPMTKALVGKQKNLPAELKAKIMAAPESPAKMYGKKSSAKMAHGKSPAKKYKSDAQRKAVHASKADKKSPARQTSDLLERVKTMDVPKSTSKQSTQDINKRVNEVVSNSQSGKGANVNFNTAFGDARKAGKKTFNYKGEPYTTETKQEKANRTADKGPTVKNAKNNVDLSKTTSKKIEPKKVTKVEVKKAKPNVKKVKVNEKAMEGKKTLGDTKLGNVKVGKNGKRLADTKVGKAFSKGRAKGVAARQARAERMAAAKAERKAKRDAKKSPAKKYASYEQQKAVYASKADGGKGNPNKMKHKK